MTTTPTEPLPDPCWPVDVSCVTDWSSTDYTDDQRALAVALAGETMRMLTGYRVGGCAVQVRPCRAGCGEDQTWRTARGAFPWVPVSLGGTWLNVGCGHDGGCGCTTLAAVTIPGAYAVTEVLLDGVVLDPTAYRLDPGGILWRTDGDVWPLCQDLREPVTGQGTWAVTYLPGVPVDGLGARAAGILAGEYLTACAGGECRLPQGVTQVVRQGVTLTLTPGTFPNGRTGIQAVDVYLERWNPHGLRSPSVVASPDRRRPRRA
ncbi:adaptor protein [Pseudanabaena phage Pam4]|nr:adaptor protein [Pseudanabaena phage Pam4]